MNLYGPTETTDVVVHTPGGEGRCIEHRVDRRTDREHADLHIR